MKIGTPPERSQIEPTKSVSTISLWVACACLFAWCANAAAHASEPKDLPILQKWSGDYPVVHLNRLPDGQQKSHVGFIGDEVTFGSVWQAFKPGEKVPEVDFSKELVVFSRNVVFYNRTSIAKVTLHDGVAEVIAIETMSALPIDDKVAMALAVISRAGVKFIQTGDERVPVTKTESAIDPLNASYTIEGRQVHLIAGHAEVEAAPGALVTSPLRVQGHARGTWFFEGDFPLILTDAHGKIIARGFATAKREWMTEKFVPFEGNLAFTKPSSGDKGTLIFKKNNPTDLAEHDDALEIPVFFK